MHSYVGSIGCTGVAPVCHSICLYHMPNSHGLCMYIHVTDGQKCPFRGSRGHVMLPIVSLLSPSLCSCIGTFPTCNTAIPTEGRRGEKEFVVYYKIEI